MTASVRAIGGVALSFAIIVGIAVVGAVVVSIATALAGAVVGLVGGGIAAITSPMRKKPAA